AQNVRHVRISLSKRPGPSGASGPAVRPSAERAFLQHRWYACAEQRRSVVAGAGFRDQWDRDLGTGRQRLTAAHERGKASSRGTWQLKRSRPQRTANVRKESALTILCTT